MHPAIGLHDHEAASDPCATRIAERDAWMRLLIHDLRGPLSALFYGMAELREMRSLAPEGQAVCQTMAYELERLAAILSDVADHERLSSRTLMPTLAPFDWAFLLQEVSAHFAPAVTRRHLRLHARAPGAELAIRGDEVLLRRVMDNLMANAVRHARGLIELEGGADGVRIYAVVRNDGPGIPPDTVERLFEPFVPFPPHVPVHGGGLGLPFCRAAVRAHGGEIRHSREGEMTCFRVELPSGIV